MYIFTLPLIVYNKKKWNIKKYIIKKCAEGYKTENCMIDGGWYCRKYVFRKICVGIIEMNNFC